MFLCSQIAEIFIAEKELNLRKGHATFNYLLTYLLAYLDSCSISQSVN